MATPPAFPPGGSCGSGEGNEPDVRTRRHHSGRADVRRRVVVGGARRQRRARSPGIRRELGRCRGRGARKPGLQPARARQRRRDSEPAGSDSEDTERNQFPGLRCRQVSIPVQGLGALAAGERSAERDLARTRAHRGRDQHRASEQRPIGERSDPASAGGARGARSQGGHAAAARGSGGVRRTQGFRRRAVPARRLRGRRQQRGAAQRR